jgi:hypothetical protein
MDDDVVLQRAALEWGYQEFVTANEKGAGRLVGFTGRDLVPVCHRPEALVHAVLPALADGDGDARRRVRREPEFLSPEALAAYASTGVAVTVRKSRKNSMNERFSSGA